ncbi:MAG: lipid-A-disaccharide synthase [Proteobacteria bacterium]|nr:lipid-A-disaccharide synthase [Pseudomonadota bacterium]
MGGRKITDLPPRSHSSQSPLFCIIAGEPSGDLLGCSLMRSLKQIFKDPQFVGVGGPLMCAEGMKSLFPMEDLTIIGVLEVLPQALNVLKRVKEVAQYVFEEQPQALITIDAPAFSFRVGRALRKLEKAQKTHPLPHIHYGAPTVWAWRPKRAKKISKFLTHLLTLFDFEPPYFLKEGLPATFVGHPILEGGYAEGKGERLRKAFKIPSDLPLICALPGSRTGEVLTHLPIFLETFQKLSHRIPKFGIVLPTLSFLKPQIEKILQKHPVSFPIWVIEGENTKKDAFAASKIALGASGTVALELAAANLPMVITYKTSWFTAFIVRRMIKIPYVSMPNIILKKAVVPELIQEACQPNTLCEALEALYKSKKLQADQKRSFKLVRQALSPASQKNPSLVAAETIRICLERDLNL